MDKYTGKYRILSARWASWDYGSNAAYFVTICTADHLHYFGQIADGEMVLTALGRAAWECWHAIPSHFPFVVLDEFVVMPNHTHGILVIDKSEPGRVETQNLASLRPVRQNRFGPQSQNLASIVRGFKIGVTKYATQNQITFAWQARYHDHVIRNTEEHERIRQYIAENPRKWAADTFYST
jgi:REP element-mobilizing transposase RayT